MNSIENKHVIHKFSDVPSGNANDRLTPTEHAAEWGDLFVFQNLW